MKILPDHPVLRWLLIPVATLLLLVILALGSLALLVNTGAGSRWALARVETILNAGEAVSLSVENVEGTLLRGLTLQGLRYTQDGIVVSLDSLLTDWNPLSLLSGRLIVGQATLRGLRVELTGGSDSARGESALANLSLTPLPVVLRVGQLSLADAVLRIGEQQYPLDSLALEAQLDGQRLQLSKLQLQSPELTLDGAIAIELQAPLPVDGELRWQYRGDWLTVVHSSWTGASGALLVQGNLEQLSIQQRWDTPLSFSSRGQLTTGLLDAGDTLRYAFDHQADDLLLPFTGIDDIAFSSVQLSTVGDLQHLQMHLQTDAGRDGLPPMTAASDAVLADGALTLSGINLASDTGSLSGNGRLEFGAAVTGQFTYRLNESDPQRYLATTLPLRLSTLAAAGQIEFVVPDTGFSGSLGLDSVSGRLGDYPVTGGGSIALREGSLLLDDLRLTSQGARLLLDGSVGSALDLNWQLESLSLDQLLTNAGGELTARGSLRGPVDEPDLQITAQGTGIKYAAYRFDTLDLQARGQGGNYHAELNGSRLMLGSDAERDAIDSVQATFDGRREQQSIDARLRSAAVNVDLALRGGFPDPDWRRWSGNLLSAEISSGYGNWRSDGETTIGVDGAALTLSDNCWRHDQTRLCLSASSAPGQRMTIGARFDRLPLNLFNAPLAGVAADDLPAVPRLADNLSLEGMLAADLDLQLSADGSYAAEINVTASDGALSIRPTVDDETPSGDTENAEVQRYNIDRMVVRGSAQASDWDFSGNLDFSRNDIDATALALQGQIALALNIDPQLNLAGRVNLDVDDLGWLEALLPEISRVRGQLHGQGEIAGQLRAPQLINGDFEVLDGAATVPALGIQLNRVAAEFSSPTQQLMRVSGSAESGSGNLRIQGDLNDPYNARRRLSLQVIGNDFELFNREDLELRISPDMAVTASQQVVHLSGRVDIPLLDLELNALPESAVDVSRDAVIVSYPAERPDLARSIATAESTFYDIPVTTDLMVSLGEQVNFAGFGLDTRLDGNLSIRQGANGSNLTYGELSVREGTYTAYNTALTLEQGKLLFFGAYDNPALDIRAVRKVDQLTAGLQINGTLKKINSQLYSSPALPDNDIIAVLITGKPFSQIGQQDGALLLGAVAGLGLERSEGITNQIRDKLGLDALSVDSTGDINNSMLTIGKYLSPSLFVRYGVGLFDKQSSMAVDYKLSDSITLQAESGEYQSVDLSVRIER